MMKCPLCGNAAHTRSSFQVSATTKERYNQCQNINCSCTFKSHETVSEIIMKPGSVTPVPPHPGRGQQQALWL
ncbi:transcriptional regulator [Pantoea ananatis]|uniref:ogr/Delta-like zinc finger family protein n=1 Tax=Pantoea ananas TaxID=553 RepID=UPI00092F6F13|nr:ogr/Delta-like zinc finger family protein [Pantoea ananatis]